MSNGPQERREYSGQPRPDQRPGNGGRPERSNPQGGQNGDRRDGNRQGNNQGQGRQDRGQNNNQGRQFDNRSNGQNRPQRQDNRPNQQPRPDNRPNYQANAQQSAEKPKAASVPAAASVEVPVAPAPVVEEIKSEAPVEEAPQGEVVPTESDGLQTPDNQPSDLHSLDEVVPVLPQIAEEPTTLPESGTKIVEPPVESTEATVPSMSTAPTEVVQAQPEITAEADQQATQDQVAPTDLPEQHANTETSAKPLKKPQVKRSSTPKMEKVETPVQPEQVLPEQNVESDVQLTYLQEFLSWAEGWAVSIAESPRQAAIIFGMILALFAVPLCAATMAVTMPIEAQSGGSGSKPTEVFNGSYTAIPTLTQLGELAATPGISQGNSSNTIDITPVPSSETIIWTEYTVVAGDTLGEIAKQFGVTAEMIAVVNGKADINLIIEGEKLHIPHFAQPGK